MILYHSNFSKKLMFFYKSLRIILIIHVLLKAKPVSNLVLKKLMNELNMEIIYFNLLLLHSDNCYYKMHLSCSKRLF